jgi:hypothetical protein
MDFHILIRDNQPRAIRPIIQLPLSRRSQTHSNKSSSASKRSVTESTGARYRLNRNMTVVNKSDQQEVPTTHAF